ncbi:MAG: hypothetical protein AAFQ35_12395 [Pseudomonadota bacterium]
MDIALCLDELTPSARYAGSVTDNTRECYDAVEWDDERAQPTWREIEERWQEIETRPTVVVTADHTLEERVAAVEAIVPDHQGLCEAVPGLVATSRELTNRVTELQRDTADLGDLRAATSVVTDVGRETKRILDDLKEQT